MTLNRNAFKPTKTDRIALLTEEENKNFSSRREADKIEINEGMNKIRLAPKFPGENEYYLMIKKNWVPYEKEDGSITRIPVFDSKVHGNLSTDLVDEYIKFVSKTLDGTSKKDAEKLKKLTDWKTGLSSNVSWVSYGWKLSKNSEEFGVFEFKKSVRDELVSLTIIEDEDEAMDVDPFTDLEEGRPILLTYDPKAKKASDYYNTKISKNSYPVSDEMFETLVKQKPLSELFRNNFSEKDLENVLSGLEIFDEDNGIDLFEEEEFQDIISSFKKEFKKSLKEQEDNTFEDEEEEDEEEEEEKLKKSSKKKIVEEDEDEDIEKPKKSSKKKNIEEEEEEKPKKSSKKKAEEDEYDEEYEEEEKPKKSLNKKAVEEEEEEDEEKEESDKRPTIEELRKRIAERMKK